VAAIALVAGLALVAPGSAAAASGTTELTSCSFSALKQAMSGGGTIDYEQNCVDPSEVVFPTEISLKGTADIEANGFTVDFYGSKLHEVLRPRQRQSHDLGYQPVRRWRHRPVRPER
jgi:hypothetical protein